MRSPFAATVCWLCIGLMLLLRVNPSFAQPSQPAKATLATTLAEAVLPAQGVVISVDADAVKLPKDAVLPGVRPTLAEAAGIYERTTQRFGAATAVAPPTMIVLNTAPGEPNIYAGMPPLDALTLLCASLTDTQWAALTGEPGLATADLNTPAERQLFAALLSQNGTLIVRPDYAAGETWDDKDKRDLTDSLPQAHLRMGQAMSFMLPDKDQPNSYYGGMAPPPLPGSPRQYVVDNTQDYLGAANTVYGAPVRAEVPNVPKAGQLDWSAPPFAVPIPLAGLKTVGDLVSLIGRTTRTELYADKRLEDQSLTLLGATSAPARDLLPALAFCLTGTYRQVGPAYVLTDDIVGLGTRRQIWAEFEKRADDLRRRPVEEAGNGIYTRHSARALSSFGDPAAYSEDEGKSHDLSTIDDGQTMLPELERPLSKLTPAQQDIIERSVENFNLNNRTQQATTEGKIIVRPGLHVQLLVPGIDNPINMNNINGGSVDQDFLWRVPQDVIDARDAAYQAKQAKEHPSDAIALPPPAPVSDVLAALKSVPRRAVLVHPRTVKEVDADVKAAQILGINELWLDVFSQGTAHIHNIGLSSVQPLAKGESDILAEALAQTKGKNIRVFPTLDLLFWGQSPPAQDADLNILGETSAQAAARWQQRKASLPPGQSMSEEYTTGGIIPDWNGVAVCPAAPEVRQSLLALVQTLAARPGVAGLIWRGTDPPGYDPLPGVQDSSPLILGYQEPMRLAFLRKFHADPIDIVPPGAYTKANTDLPDFEDDRGLSNQWHLFRGAQGLELLQTLYAAANPSPLRHLTILVKQRRRGLGGNDGLGHHIYPPGWYGSWDNPRLPLPTLHSQGEDNALGQPALPVPEDTVQAKLQSRTVVVPITGDQLAQMRQYFPLPPSRAYLLQNPMPGFVLDLDSSDDGASKSGDSLAALAAEGSSVPPVNAGKSKQ